MDGASSLRLNNGDGTFEAAAGFGAEFSAVGIAVADANAEGTMDIVVANLAQEEMRLYSGIADCVSR